MRAILTYHSIDASGSPISVHPAAFDRHVAWLASGSVTVTTIERLLALPASADAVAITFDDGFASFVETAAPRLLPHGWPVTIFVVTDHVGGDNSWGGRAVPGIPVLPLLDWPALRQLQQHGATLGAHSRTHPDLTRLSRSAVEQEVRGSADVLEGETGSRPTVFAYPYGRFDAATADLVGAVFPHACTTELRPLDGPPVPARLPRLDMYYFQAPGRIEQWGTPGFDRFITRRRRIRRIRQWLG